MITNEFTIINATEQFWAVLKSSGNRRSLTSAYLLYGHLCHLWNGCGRPASFNRQTNIICAEIALSKPTLNRHRQILKNSGLIDFVSKGKGDENIRYTIIEVKNIYLFEKKKEKNITSPVTSPVTSPDAYKQSTEKELFIIISEEVKNIYYLQDLFIQDAGLIFSWKGKGFTAELFKDGVEQWVAYHHGAKYFDYFKARNHFLNWMPNFKTNPKENERTKANKQTAGGAGDKGPGHNKYAEGF